MTIPPSPLASNPDWQRKMTALDIHTDVSDLPVVVSPDMINKHTDTITLSNRHHLPVEYVGVAPAFSGNKTIQKPDGDWVVMNLADDPIWQDGQYPMPKRVIQDIDRVIASGLDFEGIYVAHELPAGTLANHPQVPKEWILPPLPQRQFKRLERANQVSHFGWQSVGALISSAGFATILMSALALATPIALTSAMVAAASLDPIIFGLHIDHTTMVNGQPLALWYYITHWTWDE